MMYSTGLGRRGCFDLKPALCAVVLLSSAVAGCSADITRFDSASFNLNDPPSATSATPVPSEPVRSNSDFDNPVTRTHRAGPYGAGASTAGDGVQVAALPDATPPVGAQAPASVPNSPPMPPAASRAPYRPANFAAAAPAPRALAKGEAIEVQQGDTLYALSRRHQVSLAELMSLNGLSSPNLKLGQKLHLPAGKSAVRTAAATPATAYAPTAVTQADAPRAPSAAPSMTTPVMAAPSPELQAKYNSTYVMKPGDSLYKVARTYKVPFTELQVVNGISNPLKVRPGVTLKVPQGHAMTAAADPAAVVPGATAAIASPAPSAPLPSVSPAGPEAASSSVPTTSAQPTIINNAMKPAASEVAPKGDKVAVATPQAAVQANAATDQTKLRWPAQGKIIAGFGGRTDGTHNDGVNLSVPQGTEVHAAEGGVIAYAGSELKGYGNLVLVRHDNGWVTAYAHNEELLVKRGDRVKRGQVIAKAGKTGTVDQPQVHFELRQNSRPVDPTPFMEAL